MRNGKGSKRRLALVEDREIDNNWAATFGHLLSKNSPIKKLPRKKPQPEARQWTNG